MGRTYEEVRRECLIALQEYPLKKKALEEKKKAIYEEGLSQGYSPTPPGGGSIYKCKMGQKVERLCSWEITDLEREIQRIDDVLHTLYPREKDFFKYRFEEGCTLDMCCVKMNYSPASRRLMYAFEKTIVRKTAARLGYKLE